MSTTKQDYTWAMGVIRRHARKMVAKISYRPHQGKQVLILTYPENCGVDVKELAIHDRIWFAKQLIAARKHVDAQKGSHVSDQASGEAANDPFGQVDGSTP